MTDLANKDSQQTDPLATPGDHRPLLFGPHAGPAWALVLGVGLHSFTLFIMHTAVPSAIGELGGARLMAWVSTTYLVASIITGTITGRALRRFTPRQVMTVSGVVFLFGCAIAAFANSMPVLLIGRGVQGLGEGMVVATCFGMVRMLFPQALIARVFGLFALIWAVSSVLAPLASGLLTETLGWRYAVGSPALIGITLLALVGLALPATSMNSDENTDRKASLPLIRLFAVTLAILAVAIAGNLHDAPMALMLTLAGVVIFTAVLWRDRRTEHYLFPRRAFGLGTTDGVMFWQILLMPLSTAGIVVFVVLFTQTRFGFTPSVAGFYYVISSLCWSAGATLISRLDYEKVSPMTQRIGPCLHALSMVLVGSGFWLGNPWITALGLVCNGFGFGLSWAHINQTLVRSTPTADEDLAATLVPTVQSIGIATGASLAGAMANFSGLQDPVTPEMVIAASPMIFGLGLCFTLISSFMGWRGAFLMQKSGLLTPASKPD